MPNAIIDQQTGKIIVQQPLPPFNCLALEGGGVRGAAYAGAFKIFHQFGLLKDVRHIIGSSAGAIAALLAALGYAEDDIATELSAIPMEEFVEESASLLGASSSWAQIKMASRILRSKNIALASGDAIQKWLEERVARKLGKKDATFADLKAMVDSPKNQANHTLKYLYVVATNIALTLPEAVVFSHEKTGDVSIATAVRASCTVPYIFAPVEINNGKYVDAGCKRNLAGKDFDKTRYLPDGFSFNDKGMNPGTLLMKIDSRTEIDQIIWGVRKARPIKTVGEYTSAVAYAVSDNVDGAEIRDSRVVLALPDQDIGTLNFSISIDCKLNLCSSAEDVTQEFLENMVGAAYKVKVYDNTSRWLDALTLEELHLVIRQYRALLNEANQNHSTSSLPENPLEYDPNHPTAEDIEKYITYIKSYVSYRIEKLETPDLEFKSSYHPRHVNLKPTSTNKWEEELTQNMLVRIDAMKRRIALREIKIKELRDGFTNEEENQLVDHLHCDHFEKIKELAGYVEYCEILSSEVAELEMKLGLRKTHHNADDFNHHYNLLAESIGKHQEEQSISSALKAIISCVDMSNPVITHKSMRTEDNALFSYNLRNTIDCKLFIIAMMLYLEHRKSKELAVYQKIFGTMFPNEKFPKSMRELAIHSFPNIQTSSLLVHAYRIEELIQFFARSEYPGKTPNIDLDKLFNGYKPFFNAASESSDGIQLHTIFKAKTNTPDRGNSPSKKYQATK